MSRFIISTLAITLLLALVLLGGGLALAQAGDFSPQSIAYPLQDFAEQQNLNLISDPYQRASYALNLLDRRLQGMQRLAGTGYEAIALRELNHSLDQTIQEIGHAPAEGLDLLKIRLAMLLQEIERSLASLQTAPLDSPELFSAVSAKVLALENMVGVFAMTQASDTTAYLDEAMDKLAAITPAVVNSAATPLPGTIVPQTVAFPPGSAGAEHKFFPLSGKHAQLTCATCHVDGLYAGTKNQCIDCHVEKLPAEHYPGLCSDCHISSTWEEVYYEHNVIRWPDCRLCHLKVVPPDHYRGQCSACHNTRAWLPATFNHQVAMATNCQSCHSDDRPANHYAGQCSACHKTRAWLPASFNHNGQVNCQSCHSDDRPANHFGGQCSACHSTRAWLPATFNHNGQSDCQSCHSDDRPANHYSGQCSTCHNTSSWQGATFSHSGLTDCQSCHSDDRPANHYSGQCSACHSTSSWQGASFSHKGLTDCQSCHTAPSGHWAGQCSQCHTTSGWGKVSVSGHTFPMEHGDANGECSACHDGTSSNVNCYRCHNKADTEKKHQEEGILDIAGRCLECHPDGKED